MTNSLMSVALFTEVYHPVVNGVVASIDALRHGLHEHGIASMVVAPRLAGAILDDENVLRVPSLPLPTRTQYRLVVPHLAAEQKRRITQCQIVHTHSPFLTGWMGVSTARRAGVPVVTTYHTQLEEYAHYIPFERALTKNAARTLTRTYANAVDTVIVPTPAMERRLRTLGVRSPIEVVPSGIDLSHFASGRLRADLRAKYALGDEHVVLFVGRLGREKNVELALAAIAALGREDVVLIVAGDGPHRAALAAFAQRIGVAGRVRFAGHVDRGDLPDLYAMSDAFLFTSTTETQGLVLAEALAAGRRIVAVETPQTAEVLGGSGELVAPEPVALAAALTRALAADSTCESAAHLAFERYSLALQTQRILDIYGRLLSRSQQAA